jgi:hypothetical protein
MGEIVEIGQHGARLRLDDGRGDVVAGESPDRVE